MGTYLNLNSNSVRIKLVSVLPNKFHQKVVLDQTYAALQFVQLTMQGRYNNYDDSNNNDDIHDDNNDDDNDDDNNNDDADDDYEGC